MDNKCEWKKDRSDFFPCMGMVQIISSDISTKGSFVLSDYDKCPSCGANIRKPEEKPLIVKSGETWVVHWKGIDRLLIRPDKYGETDIEGFLKGWWNPLISRILDWKPFSEIEKEGLTDEIAKLRPMCIVSNNPSILEMKEMLVYVHPGKGIDNAYRYTTTGTTWANCRLATPHELQEASTK